MAQGKLHLSAVSLWAPHLRPHDVGSLLAEATHKSRAEVERIVARRFPRRDVPALVRPLAGGGVAASPTAQLVANIAAQLSPVTVAPMNLRETQNSMDPLRCDDEARAVRQVVSRVIDAAAADCGPESVSAAVRACIAGAVAGTIVNAAASVVPEAAPPGAPPGRVTPRSAGRYAWQLTADQDMQDLLEEAQRLMGRSGPRDLQAVLKRGLEVLVEGLRRTRCAATSQPRRTPSNTNGRHVPRAVVRAVFERDGHQCTFHGPDGRRCTERMDLQLDHVVPFARGGRTTVENLRLLCPVHDQHEAERVYGEAHIREQRTASRARAEQAKRARAEAEARARGKDERARWCGDGRDPCGDLPGST